MIGRRDFVLAGAGLAAASQDPPRFRLGVVDLRLCFDPARYARPREVAAEVAALRETYAKEIQERQKTLVDLREDVAALAPASDLYVDKIRKAGHAEVDIKVLQEVSRRRARDLTRESQARVYAEILRVVRIVADDRKVDLVVRSGEPRLADDDGESLAILTRDILHHREAVDLTPAVLDRLNADWAAAWLCAKCKRKAAAPACPDCGARRP